MHLEGKDIVNRPVEEVYALVRDGLPKLAPYLPNVERIEVVESQKLPNGRLYLVNHWHAKAEIPKLLQKFMKPEIASWKDYATWDDETRSVDYRLESFFAKDLYSASGKNTFVAADRNRTEVCVSCDIVIHSDRMPGVPKLLAKQLLPTVEGLLAKLVEPNLRSLAKGLNSYFAENG